LVRYLVTIGDDDGTSARYRAAVPDIIDDDELPPDRNLPTIAMASLRPFADLLDCPSNPFGSLDPSGPPPLSHDPGCITSVSLRAGCEQISARWRVDEPSTYRFETAPSADQGPPAGCRATTTFKVLSEDGSTGLAVGTAATRPACASLDYRFDAPGTYLIAIDKTNGAASCDTRDPDDEGLVELRVTRLN
jgi:hypothetical protein